MPYLGCAAESAGEEPGKRIGDLLIKGIPEREVLWIELIEVVATGCEATAKVACIGSFKQPGFPELLLQAERELLDAWNVAIGFVVGDSLTEEGGGAECAAQRLNWCGWKALP